MSKYILACPKCKSRNVRHTDDCELCVDCGHKGDSQEFVFCNPDTKERAWTISDLKTTKEQLEHNLAVLLMRFERETGLRVAYIEMNKATKIGAFTGDIDIKVEVKL